MYALQLASEVSRAGQQPTIPATSKVLSYATKFKMSPIASYNSGCYNCSGFPYNTNTV